MCARVPNLEWSGVLFYTTTGNFGEDGFSVEAQELYLMDIGTSTFTGYDYESDFVEYMMKNPHLMEMKKGHIHSHNTFGVFFSDTDTSEIHDNSEFHNYYLSLIVNNKNAMTAQIAFRGTRKMDSVSHFTYRGDNGEVKTGTYANSNVEDVVYVYSCDIDKPVDETLEKKVEELMLKKQVTLKAPITSYVERSKQTEIPFAGKHNQFYWEDDMVSEQVEKHGRKVSKVAADPQLEGFMAKVISGDFISEDPLTSVLHKLKKMTGGEAKKLAAEVEKRLMNFYIDSFPEDQHLIKFNKRMEQCQNIIMTYDDVYAVLADELWDAFNIEID